MAGIYTFIDPLVKLILRSPAHSLLSKNTMLLMYHGNKSGKKYTLPVSYAELDGKCYAFTGVERRWWRNLQLGYPVELWLRGRRVPALATAHSEDTALIAATLSKFLKVSPRDAKPSNVRMDADSNPNEEDVELAAQRLVCISIELKE